MIVSAMAYGVLVALLFGLAALSAERLLVSSQLPRRLIWAVSLAASLLFPIGMIGLNSAARDPPLVVPATLSSVEPAFPPPQLPNFASEPPSAARHPYGIPPARPQFESVTAVLWATGSAGLLFFFSLASFNLMRLVRESETTEIDGRQVLVSDHIGPAVLGFFAPRVVLPRWVLRSSIATRTAILKHEQQHIAARDPLLIFAALICLVITPWNLPLWWQARRLRLAIELDCDARVVREGIDTSCYAEALVAVGRNKLVTSALAIGLGARRSQLERRIRTLYIARGRCSFTSIGGSLVALAACVTVAAAIPTPRVLIGSGSAFDKRAAYVEETGEPRFGIVVVGEVPKVRPTSVDISPVSPTRIKPPTFEVVDQDAAVVDESAGLSSDAAASGTTTLFERGSPFVPDPRMMNVRALMPGWNGPAFFDIPGSQLREALQTFASQAYYQTGAIVTYRMGTLDEEVSLPFTGYFDVGDALSRLLEGTSFGSAKFEEGVFFVVPESQLRLRRPPYFFSDYDLGRLSPRLPVAFDFPQCVRIWDGYLWRCRQQRRPSD